MEFLPQPHRQAMTEKTNDLTSRKIIKKIENRPTSADKKGAIPASKRTLWLEEELSQISAFAKQKKPWKTISKIVNLLFHQGKHVRRAKECKKKWIFDLQNKTESSWTTEEDQILEEKKNSFGKKWGKISQFLYCRTGRQVKARAEYLEGKKNGRVQDKDNLNFYGENSGFFIYSSFDPNLSFKVENLSELRNYGNILANSLYNPDVILANLVLDDFCKEENDVFF